MFKMTEMLIIMREIAWHYLRGNAIPTHTGCVNFPLPNSICALLSEPKWSHLPLVFLLCPSVSQRRWESELCTTGIQRKWVTHTWALWTPAQTCSLAHSSALACILRKGQSRNLGWAPRKKSLSSTNRTLNQLANSLRLFRKVRQGLQINL